LLSPSAERIRRQRESDHQTETHVAENIRLPRADGIEIALFHLLGRLSEPQVTD
jgi:hypothetical protein